MPCSPQSWNQGVSVQTPGASCGKQEVTEGVQQTEQQNDSPEVPNLSP